MTNEIQTQNKSQIAIGNYQGSRSILLNSLSEIHSFATMVCKTDLVPKNYRGKPEDATVAIIYGMEIGLPPMASLQNVAVVNGSPTVWGDGQLSLVQASGKYENHKSWFEGEYPKDDFKACFEVKRLGAKDVVKWEYSIADARKAGLWGKVGSWQTSDKKMLHNRARAFALREAFADVLKGIRATEEMEGVDDSNKEPKDVTPPTPVQDWVKMGKHAWNKDDIKNDFPNTTQKEKPAEKIAAIVCGYEIIQDALFACESLEDLEKFEKDYAEDLDFMLKDNPTDHKKLAAMIQTQKAELKLSSELNINPNQ